jgi:hypothetical protein
MITSSGKDEMTIPAGQAMTPDASHIRSEFDAARTRAAIVVPAPVGRIEVTGADGLDLLHRMSTNDLAAGTVGQVITTVFTTDKGRIVDYVHVAIRSSSLLLLTSPSNEASLIRWIEKYTIMEEIALRTITEATSTMSVIGPQAYSIVESLTHQPVVAGQILETQLACGAALILQRNEFNTESIDIITHAENGTALQELILTAGSAWGATRIGAEAYELFRIAQGIPAIGAELSEAFNPFEAGLLHAVSFRKGCYIGQEVIARLDTYHKVQKQKWGLVLDGSFPAPRAGSTVLAHDEPVGTLTSVAKPAVDGKRVALGILKNGTVDTDDHIAVMSEGIRVPGIVSAIPIVL